MKNRSILNLNNAARFAAVAAAPFLLTRATAAPVSFSPGIMAQVSIELPHVQIHFGDDQRKQLRHIYWELENAGQAYNGHKARAMEEIRKAAEITGMDLHGEGYGRGPESLEWSDARLRQARDQLADLASRTAGREQEHLRQAVHEIDRALETIAPSPAVAPTNLWR